MKEVWIKLLTAFISSLGFSLLYGLRRRFLFFASLGGLLSVAVYLLCGRFLSAEFLPYLLASAVSVLYAELLAHLEKTPATLFLTPAILPLVPGGSLYYTMSCAIRGDLEGTRTNGLMTLEAALAIAAGISIVLAARQLHTRKK